MIYPESRFVTRADKELLLGQRGAAFWLYGLSGSGKSTLVADVEHRLNAEQRLTVVLDGDNIRNGLNAGLGFSDEDRRENIRRIAHVAKLFCDNGCIVFISAITPRRELRALARGVLLEDFHEVYVRASFETCQQRDPKGLYKKVAAGEVQKFTGKDSAVEEPDSDSEAIILDTEANSAEACALTLLGSVKTFCLSGVSTS